MRNHNSTVQEITIKVPAKIAEIYNQASDWEKQEITNKITFVLENITRNKHTAIQQLRQTMAEIGKKAQEKGITPEILEELLGEDD